MAWNAELIYQELIGRFDPFQAALALRSFAFQQIRLKLHSTLGRQKWAELLELLAPKLTSRPDRTLLDMIREFSGTPDQLAADSKIKPLVLRWMERNTPLTTKGS